MEYKLLNIDTSEDDFAETITDELNKYASDGWRVVSGYPMAIGVFLICKEEAPRMLVSEIAEAEFGTRKPLFI